MKPKHKKYLRKHHVDKKENAPPQKKLFEPIKTRFLIIILISIVGIVYINSVFGKFVWDDQTIVVRNEAIKSFKNVPFIATHDFAKMTNYNGNIYRPMQELSYMVDFFLWGTYPAGFHVTNVLFHIGCVLFLFYVILSICNSRSIAFFSAIIFGIHPINTEAISYISGRSDPMYLFFLLLSFLFYIKLKDLNKNFTKLIYLTLSLVLYSLSLLSRETALVFPAILIAYEMCCVGNKKIQKFIKPSLFLIITAVFLVVRSNILSSTNPIQNQPIMLQGQVLPLFPLLSKIIVKYLRLMLLPIGLHMWNVTDLVKAMIEKEFFLNIAVLISLATVSFRMIKRDKTLVFWFLWFIIFLLPHLPLIRLNALFAEHWIYASSIGIYVIISTLIFKGVSKYNISKWAVSLFLFLIIVCLSALTIGRNMDWKDELSIYNDTLKYARFPRVLTNVGVYYGINGQYDKSIEAHKEAIALSPNTPLFHNNIAAVYYKKGQRDLAIKHWKKSLRLDPNQAKIKHILSNQVK